MKRDNTIYVYLSIELCRIRHYLADADADRMGLPSYKKFSRLKLYRYDEIESSFETRILHGALFACTTSDVV